MSSKGMGVAHVFGVLTLIVVTAIVAILYVRNAETSIAAKQSADQTLEEVREILDARTSQHQRAIEDTRTGLNLPDPYSR